MSTLLILVWSQFSELIFDPNTLGSDHGNYDMLYKILLSIVLHPHTVFYQDASGFRRGMVHTLEPS